MTNQAVPYEDIAHVMQVLSYVVEHGVLPTVACDQLGVSYQTFARLTATYPQLRSMREEAEDRLYDQMAEALPMIDSHPVYGRTDAKMATVISSNIKWLLERRRSKIYGAKSFVEHQITADREVLDALNNAKARAQGQSVENHAQAAVIDLAVVDGIATAVSDVAVKAVPSRLIQSSSVGTIHSRWDEDAYQREFADIC